MRRRTVLLLCLVVFSAGGIAVAAAPRLNVRVSPGSFDPSIGQHVDLSCAVDRRGTIDIVVVDRDGFAVRHLTTHVAIPKGIYRVRWDGRDDKGRIVSDEAYSWKVDFASSSGNTTWFPAADPPPGHLPLRAKYYDRRSGIVAYTLPAPCRVHMQAGTSHSLRDGKTEGPVLKTIVNREPRAGGAIIEQWNGRDESGTINVADLPEFVVAIAAQPLPSGSVIAVGNRNRNFLAEAASRIGESLIHSGSSHEHHARLSALDDVAPRMRIALGRSATATEASILVSLEGATAPNFVRQPGRILVFADGKQIKNVGRPAAPGANISVVLLELG